jgi:hypothetical protein
MPTWPSFNKFIGPTLFSELHLFDYILSNTFLDFKELFILLL